MEPKMRRRLDSRLSLLGLSWSSLSDIIGVNSATISRMLSPNYTTIPLWLEEHILYATGMKKEDVAADSASFDPACLVSEHRFFGPVCSPLPELKEAARWFRESYQGTDKPRARRR